jgi:hypothetical protein
MHFRECKPFFRFTLFSCADAGHVIYYSLRQNTSYVMRIFEKIHVLKCKNVILTLFVHFSYIVAHTFLYWSSLHTFATNSNRKKSIKFNIDLILSWKFYLLANSHNKSLKILTFSTFIFFNRIKFPFAALIQTMMCGIISIGSLPLSALEWIICCKCKGNWNWNQFQHSII